MDSRISASSLITANANAKLRAAKKIPARCDRKGRRCVIMSEHDRDSRDESLRTLAIQAARNDTAMAALLTTVAPLIRRYCTALLSRYGRVDWAEDMVQEVMLTLHLKLHTFNTEMSFTAWTQAIAKHKIIDALRRERMVQVPIEEAEALDDSSGEAAMARRDLAQLLARLKPPAGEIIHALKVEGVSIRDLAEKFATSESNIKVIVHRGLRRLARLLTEEKA
jgi:RNA polymerase sigma-70 factor (ECF subfamily)